MEDIKQMLRELTLETFKNKKMADKLFAMNLLENILSSEMSAEEIIEAIASDKLPKFYKPLRKKKKG